LFGNLSAVAVEKSALTILSTGRGSAMALDGMLVFPLQMRPSRTCERSNDLDYHLRVAVTPLDLLARTPIFRRLAPEDRERVASVSDVRTYARGDVIFGEGDASDSFYVIASGRVKISKLTPGGKEVILEIFGVGDPLGAVAVYEGFPFPASATALETTTCVLIPRRQFFLLLEHHPTLVRALLLGLTTRLVELTNRLAALTGTRVEARLARAFLKMADDMGRRDARGEFIPMSLSRQDLADLTGTTIETAIRVMSRWSKQQLVQTEKDGFRILDRKTLESLSQE
jgi:CRP/FNR family transcriptional regulator